MNEIFPKIGQVSVPLSNLFEEYMLLFDEPENSILSEAKAADNKVENLKKIIDEAAKAIESEPQGWSEPQGQSEPTHTRSTF